RVLNFFETTFFEENKAYIICSHGDPLYYIYQKISGVRPLPEVKLGDKVIAPPDYQKKGSIRIVSKENATWSVLETVNQEDLKI
ncbi:MAG: hypothetical protein M1426_00610, partial [Patescibacteria group bacterium]|nr:hypothetical protein [Patescibacteria group bacterium]